LYILVITHLFVGIAILADDFFVPSLEAISEALDLSEDVAGATFMAAGSSAPELFTSLAGVAVDSDVGVGTIVGSAVFNILVIVALSGALAGSVLLIDWTAIVRDTTFYGSSIVLFIIFAWDGYIAWWEGLILVLCYVLYIYVMKRNQELKSWLLRTFSSNQVAPLHAGQQSGVTGDGPPTPTDSAIGGEDEGDDLETRQAAASPALTNPALERLKQNGKVARHSVIGRLQDEEPSDVSVTMKRSSSLDADQFRKVLVKNKKTVMSPIAGGPDNLVPMRVMSSSTGNLDRAGSTESLHSHKSFHHSSKHAMSSLVTGLHRTSKTSGKSARRPNSGRPDGANGPSHNTPQRSPLSSSHNATSLESSHVNGKPADDDDQDLTCSQRCCVPCVYGDHPAREDGQSSWVLGGKWFAFCFSAPYVWAFTNTIPPSFRPAEVQPDEENAVVPPQANEEGVSTQDNDEGPQELAYYKTAFAMCIFWIMTLSFIMVLFVIRLGCMIGIDDYVMGLVIVAAGTSIPDALSSILVAQDGAGSMAVSNAIGSNVFDIDLGIGIPFMIRAWIDNSPVDLLDESSRSSHNDGDVIDHVKFSFILLGILAVTIVGFKLSHFRLTKRLGCTLFAMYVLFITYALVQELVCKRDGTEC